jgi:membrane associated rhomboid family serine protease
MKKNIPVSIFLAIIIVFIYALYLTSVIKAVPCARNFVSTFLSNFVHIDPYHLVANLIAIYALSRVEEEIGAKRFIGLIVFLLVFNTIAETLLYKFTKIPCAIGFSGVLFGVMTWEIVARHELNWLLLVAMIIIPSIQNPRASVISHAIGAFAGIVVGTFWKHEKKIENFS